MISYQIDATVLCYMIYISMYDNMLSDVCFNEGLDIHLDIHAFYLSKISEVPIIFIIINLILKSLGQLN